jgi:uncharacterized protein YqjF (DUF2071 family)
VSGAPFLTARWRDLVMLTWAVEARLLRGLLPRGVELDTWRGEALASVVAFRFEAIRLRGVPVPCHTAFPEVNLRFYVRRRTGDGQWRRGVVFVQEMVPKRAVAIVARRLYGEPYVVRPLRATGVDSVVDGRPRRTIVHEWRRAGRRERVVALATAAPHPLRAGSVEEFIAEHYHGYTGRGAAATREYRVAHPRWNVAPLAEGVLDADIAGLYGAAWAGPLGAAPVSRFLADGSAVAVFPGESLPGTALPGGPATAPGVAR